MILIGKALFPMEIIISYGNLNFLMEIMISKRKIMISYKNQYFPMNTPGFPMKINISYENHEILRNSRFLNDILIFLWACGNHDFLWKTWFPMKIRTFLWKSGFSYESHGHVRVYAHVHVSGGVNVHAGVDVDGKKRPAHRKTQVYI